MDKTGEKDGPHESTIDVFTERPGTSGELLKDVSPLTSDNNSFQWLESARKSVSSQFEYRQRQRVEQRRNLRSNLGALAGLVMVLLVVLVFVLFATVHP